MNAKELEIIRKNLGWSKVELSNRIGVNPKTVYSWINQDLVPEPIARLIIAFSEGYRPKEG